MYSPLHVPLTERADPPASVAATSTDLSCSAPNDSNADDGAAEPCTYPAPSAATATAAPVVAVADSPPSPPTRIQKALVSILLTTLTVLVALKLRNSVHVKSVVYPMVDGELLRMAEDDLDIWSGSSGSGGSSSKSSSSSKREKTSYSIPGPAELYKICPECAIVHIDTTSNKRGSDGDGDDDASSTFSASGRGGPTVRFVNGHNFDHLRLLWYGCSLNRIATKLVREGVEVDAYVVLNVGDTETTGGGRGDVIDVDFPVWSKGRRRRNDKQKTAKKKPKHRDDIMIPYEELLWSYRPTLYTPLASKVNEVVYRGGCTHPDRVRMVKLVEGSFDESLRDVAVSCGGGGDGGSSSSRAEGAGDDAAGGGDDDRDDELQVKTTEQVKTKDEKKEEKKFRPLSPSQQAHHRCLLDYDGVGYSRRMAWYLQTGSVVLRGGDVDDVLSRLARGHSRDDGRSGEEGGGEGGGEGEGAGEGVGPVVFWRWDDDDDRRDSGNGGEDGGAAVVLGGGGGGSKKTTTTPTTTTALPLLVPAVRQCLTNATYAQTVSDSSLRFWSRYVKRGQQVWDGYMAHLLVESASRFDLTIDEGLYYARKEASEAAVGSSSHDDGSSRSSSRLGFQTMKKPPLGGWSYQSLSQSEAVCSAILDAVTPTGQNGEPNWPYLVTAIGSSLSVLGVCYRIVVPFGWEVGRRVWTRWRRRRRRRRGGVANALVASLRVGRLWPSLGERRDE